MAAILGTFSFVSILALQRSTQNTLEERLALTQQRANGVDFVLQKIKDQTETRLLNHADTIVSSPGILRDLLHEWQKEMVVFPLYLSLLNNRGEVILVEPDTWPPMEPRPSHPLIGTDRSILAHIKSTLKNGKTEISNVYLDPLYGKPAFYISLPILTGAQQTRGILEIAFDTMSPDILRFINGTTAGHSGYAEVVDSDGTVLSSTRQELLLSRSRYADWLAINIKQKNAAVSTWDSSLDPGNQADSTKQIITLAPLSVAPWGIVLRQDEDEALAPTRRLQQGLVLLGFLSLLAVAFVAWLTTEHVFGPVRVLTESSQRLATGNLNKPVPLVGTGEIGALAASFELMRNKLRDSLEELRQRSYQLENCEHARSEIMQKLISAEEEERKRMARDLHDETSQAITSVIVGLQAIAESPPMESDILTQKIKALQSTAQKTLEEIHKVIYELRPSILDDLGLMPAIKWYAESRLENAGIKLYVETAGREERLSPDIEIAIFRIVQEAVTNMIKHARAESASISLDFSDDSVVFRIEDDGRGFSMERGLPSDARTKHFGLLGIKERVESLNGHFSVSSQPGKGTVIEITIPVIKGEASTNG